MKQPVLQDRMPAGQAKVAAAPIPAMRPVVGPWLFCDMAYGAQMVLRRSLLETCERDVYAQTPGGLGAARGFLAMVLDVLPDGFVVEQGDVVCPDGVRICLDWDAPLWSVGHMLQQDVCILEKQDAEHVLSGAVLCFPASWTLSEKIGKPLSMIHAPVTEYDTTIAARVQRMFDGARPDVALWRANALRYVDPALYQPRREDDPRIKHLADAAYMRSERQTVLRLPRSDAVAFVIHTTVVAL